MSIVKLARPEIQRLSVYEAAAQVDDTTRLNANESPDGYSVGDFRRPLNRYPEVRPKWLQVALSDYFGCRSEQLLVTRGSSEAIDLIIRSFCTAGADNLVIPSPSFSMYRHYAEVQGAGVVEVETAASDDFRIDVAALLAACNDSTKVVVVCTPNNPTGLPLGRKEIEQLLEGRRGRSVVVVDEAYVEFGNEPSLIEILDNFPNLIVLRTLSKALGFAGARCGAAAGTAGVIRILNAVQAPYALATPVVECIEDVMQSNQLQKAKAAVAGIVSERKRLTATIADYPFVQNVWPSEANFFLIRVDSASELMEHCAAQKVLLRDFSGQLANCIRITVGNRKDNDRLLEAFDSLGATHGD